MAIFIYDVDAINMSENYWNLPVPISQKKNYLLRNKWHEAHKDWSKLVSVTADGAPAMVDVNS